MCLVSPMALRVAESVQEDAAFRCAIACGHAATRGAACCPMSSAAGGAAMAACPAGDPQSAAPTPAPPPAILVLPDRLTVPTLGSLLASGTTTIPLSPASPPPDHVPLLLS